jgi:hypothetical protein
MIVLVLLIVGLLIDIWNALSSFWPLLLVAAGLCLALRWVMVPMAHAQVTALCDHLRHKRARREIDQLATETQRAMIDAALRRSDIIEGTAVEVRPK